MYIGAFGTLGILVEATLKLQPRPEAQRAIIGRFPFVSTVMDTACRVMDSGIMPAFIEMANPVPVAILARRAGGGLGDAGFPLIVGAVGPEETVAWQMAETERLFHQVGAVQVIHLDDERYRLAIEVLREFPTGQVVPRGMLPGVVCRASVVPADVGRLYQVAEDRCQKLAVGCGMASHVGNGAVTFVFYQEEPFAEAHTATLAGIIEELQTQAAGMGGTLVVEHAPAALKDRVAVWGPPRPEWPLMKTLKTRFDPRSLLNPGRFVGGI
jgi:FAD/FMN-containing dehydrogenase